MVVIDEELLTRFRQAGRCEWCGKAGGVDPSHVFSRGSGRVDAAVNLTSMCRECHNAYHAGLIDRVKVVAMTAAREGMTSADAYNIVFLFRRLSRDANMAEFEMEARGLSAEARASAEIAYLRVLAGRRSHERDQIQTVRGVDKDDPSGGGVSLGEVAF